MLSSVAAACSSKLNERQKRLRSARPQARLMRLPNGEWMTSCMPPASSKKRSSTISCCVGSAPSAARAAARYATSCTAAGASIPASATSQAHAPLGAGVEVCLELAAQPRHARRQLVGAPGRLAQPERDGRRLAVRVLDADAALLDAQDAVRDVAELEDVALQALDREVLVHRADELRLRLEDHLVVGGVGDGAAGGDRGEARAAAAADALVDGVVVDERAVAAAAGAVALRQHAHQLLELRARQIAVRVGAAAQREQRRARPTRCAAASATICCASTSSGLSRHAQAVELAAPHRRQQRRALDQVVARQREQPSLGRAADGVAGAPDALQQRRDRARRADLAHEVDVADVDAELERGGRDQGAQLPGLEPLLGIEARLLGHAAVVGGDVLLAETLGQVARDALGLAARVDEHQRGAVLADQLRQAVVELRPHLARHHRLERRGRDLERQVAGAHVTGVDDAAGGLAGGVEVAHADQEARHLLDRLLGGRQADARQPAAGERLEPLERQRQVHAALAAGHGVDLIHDHGAGGGEHLPARLRAHEDVERLGRRHHDVRRALAHRGALVLRRIAGAHEGADAVLGQAARAQLGVDAGERRLEVAVDVVRERLERRDVHHVGLVGERAGGESGAHQLVDDGQEGRQRLARAGGRGDQDVAPRRDLRPRRLLCRGGCGEGALEPGADGWMKLGGHERIEAQPRSAGQPSRRDLMQRTAPRGTPRCTRRPRARGPGSRAAAAALALRAVPPRPRRTGRQHFAVRSHGDAPSRNAMLPVRTAPGPRPQRRSGRTLQRRVKSQP